MKIENFSMAECCGYKRWIANITLEGESEVIQIGNIHNITKGGISIDLNNAIVETEHNYNCPNCNKNFFQ